MFLVLFFTGAIVPSFAFLDSFFLNSDCNQDEFMCSNGVCISQRLRCDGHNDCQDSSDELACDIVECLEPSFFNCKNGKCISSVFVCDDENDCGNYLDEIDCDSFKKSLNKNETCSEDMWQCTDKLCIFKDWVCNGEIDCIDGSDEGIGCSTNINCDGFKCKNHHCIPHEWRCDGRDDCHDNSDEISCENHVNRNLCTLSRNRFLCGDNQTCIEFNSVCNKVDDCPDGSDEGPLCLDKTTFKNCSHRMVHLPTGVKCVCPPGYTGDEQCVEINECNEYALCDQKCRNKVGSYECYCEEKYILQDDKNTCKAHGSSALMVFSTKNEIRGYILNTNTYYPIARDLKQVVGVAFDGEHIFWTEIFSGHESIVRSKADGSNRELVVTSGLGHPEDVAVDWLTKNIYFTDAEKQHVGVCTNDGTVCTILVNKDIEKPRAIVLNVNKGEMYWTDWGKPGKIAYAYMDGSNDKAFVSDNIHWPNGLTLDYPNGRLYWTDAHENSIESINLDGTDRRIILKDIVKHPYAIGVFENRLYWSDWDTHSIQSCDKFTGKNHETIVKEKSNLIYGLSIFHLAMETRTENPCISSFCSDICLLSGPSYKCACPQNKVLGADKHTCRVVERKQMLILGAQNVLIHVEHPSLGGHKVTVVPASVEEVGALAYGSTNNTLYVSDLGTKRILSINLGTGTSRVLPFSGLGKVISMDYDTMGDNLYICDETRGIVEVLNLNTMSRRALLRDMEGEIPISIALVPEEGVMFIAFKKNSKSSQIDRFYMDGTGRTHSIDGKLSQDVTLHYDRYWHRILIADAHSGKIETTSIEGDDRLHLKSLSSSPVGISSLNSDIFWVNENSRRLYWSSRNSPGYYNQKITLDIAKNVKKIHLTAVTPNAVPFSQCHLDNGHCSHLCLRSQHRTVCACPMGLDLKDDQKTCSETVNCLSDEYLCLTSNQCIKKSAVCNGHPDCIHGEDEQGCAAPKLCDVAQFQCQNGDCIETTQVCDHHFDCKDKSDELKCNKNRTTCPSYEFQCADNTCVPRIVRCDNYRDCTDGSDELDCIQNICDSSQFRCKSGGCIPKSWECNSEFDCVDMSDEHEKCVYSQCALDMFKCTNAKCVDKALRCDGQDDCGDNSDEENCVVDAKSRCEYSCSSNSSICISKAAVCDGKFDCPHREDEKNCSNCLIDEFECDNKNCIPHTFLCDGTKDCEDGSDEKVAFCFGGAESRSSDVSKDEPCTGFRCKNGHCINFDLVCNNHTDCYDGSDENGSCSTSCKSSNPCDQKCIPTPNGPTCRCNTGYQLSGDEKTCTDINECAQDPPVCSQLCRNREGGYSCDCYLDYLLKFDKVTCKAVGDPMSMIYVTNNQLREFNQKTNSLRVLYSDEMPKITGIAMAMRNNVIFMALENSQTLERLDIKTKNRQYIEHIGEPRHLAIDWITNNIYYYNAQADSKSINVCNFEDKLCAQVISIDIHRQVSALTVDSANRVLFYSVVSWWVYSTPSFIIYKTNLDGTGRHELVSNTNGYVTGLTFNSDSKQLYYIDQHQKNISSIGYDGKMKQVLFSNITKGTSLQLFENNLYYLMRNGYMGKCQLHQPRACHEFQLHAYSNGLFLLNQEALQPKYENPCLNHTCSHMCVLGDSDMKCLCEDGKTVSDIDECDILQKYADDKKKFNFVTPDSPENKSTGSKVVTGFVISFFMIVIAVALVYYAKRKTNIKLSMDSIRFINPTYNTQDGDLDKPILIPGQHEYSNPVQPQGKQSVVLITPDKELQKDLITV